MSLNTRRNFNLIREAAEAEEEVRNEKSWYVVTNVFVVCVCIVISVFTYVLNQYSKNNLQSRIDAITENNITALESTVRKEAEESLIGLNDRYTIYRGFIVNNIDFTLFYDEIKSIYPNLQITEFSLSPETELLEVDAVLPSGGYGNLSQIIQKFEENKFFEVIKISNISFAYKGDISQDNNDDSSEQTNTNLTESSLVYSLDRKDDISTTFSMSIQFDPEKIIRYNF